MTPLGGLDALFLHLETPATPMHVGALNLLDAPAPTIDLYRAIVNHVAARLSSSPVFTRRLQQLPLSIANPVWRESGEVDLAHHIRRLRLPAPGTPAQLESAVARLHARPLDRRRPLWQFWLIEGLADGGYAFYSKVHHAAVDGAAGVALAQALLDSAPTTAPAATPAAGGGESSAQPGTVRLLATALAHNGRAGLALVRRLPALARAAGGLVRDGRAGVWADWMRRFDFAPPTVLNRAIDAARSVATVSVALEAARSIAAAHGVTINDVVLATVGGALRSYLQARGELPLQPLLAAMPVSLRESGDTRMNTQAWMMQANLATDIADPGERLRAIHASTDAAKAMTREMRPALDVSLPSLGLPWLLGATALLYGAGTVAERLPRLANVVVSNVPGPPTPLYLAGARLRSYWPLSIVEHGLGLNVTVMRYVDSLDFGIVAARRALPDPAPLVQAMRESLAELLAIKPAERAARGQAAAARRAGKATTRPRAAAPGAAAGGRPAGRRKPRGPRRDAD